MELQFLWSSYLRVWAAAPASTFAPKYQEHLLSASSGQCAISFPEDIGHSIGHWSPSPPWVGLLQYALVLPLKMFQNFNGFRMQWATFCLEPVDGSYDTNFYQLHWLLFFILDSIQNAGFGLWNSKNLFLIQYDTIENSSLCLGHLRLFPSAKRCITREMKNTTTAFSVMSLRL